jgi:methylated-DNA-protein-cysteine methyltransferase related protein
MVKKKFGRNEPTFSEKVLFLALRIPKGRVTTYGALARAAGGGPMASQSITSLLGKAWERGEKTIPFHRIVYADGKVWMSDEYREKRMKQYKREKIHLNDRDRIKNFHDIVLETDDLWQLK